MLFGRATPAVAVATLMLVAAGAGAASSGKPVKGTAFATVAPSGWSVKAGGAATLRTFALASAGAKLDAVSVPTLGGVGITIIESTPQALAKAFKKKTLPTSPIKLLAGTVGTPTAATDVRVTEAAHATTLVGAKAARATLTYTYAQRSIVQQDLVATHAGHVYFVEADVDAAHASAATTALKGVLKAWHWR
jgi:hypothetical protein